MEDSNTKIITKFFIYVTIACVIVALYSQGIMTAKQGWSLISIAPAPEVLWLLFDKYLWSIRIFKRFMPPDLNGVWTGTCRAEHDDDSHEMKLIINQTFSKICVISNSQRVDSPSRTASLEKHYANSWQLVYTWVGTFKTKAPQNGNVHGATFLSIIHGNNELRGEYVSSGERLTKGVISVTREGSQ